jgi:hypothetical protein
MVTHLMSPTNGQNICGSDDNDAQSPDIRDVDCQDCNDIHTEMLYADNDKE